ncbi:MAG TPA: transposase [Phenylobacterium sp.]|jgi:transposase
MTYSAVVVGPERRRRFTEDQKLAILTAAFAPGAVASDVARQADVCTSVLYRWRQIYRAQGRPDGFAPAVVIDAPRSQGRLGTEPSMVVEFSGGARVSIASSAPAALVTAALRALR